MLTLRLLAFCLLAALAAAQVEIFPVSQVRPGLQGTGKTVFQGSRIEEFDVELLGVLENAGPKQSIILARLSGGPLARTGVLQGMSGSPVYVDGKLLGAVALAFPLSTEPIAGIRPIGEMLATADSGSSESAPVAGVSLTGRDLAHVFPPRREILAGSSRLVEIATPVSFSGFTAGAIRQFAPQLRALGLEPAQGLSGGGTSTAALGDPSLVQPGSMISVLLLSGDMSVGADGTITYVNGSDVYAFGHRFLSVGATELPFARSEVLALAPNLQTSFKISAARESMGVITGDYNTAVTGVLGRRAATVPLSIRVRGAHSSGAASYQMQMVSDRYLSPLLLQMALFSAIEATQRTVGPGTVTMRGSARFEGGQPVVLDDIYASEGSVPQQVSLAAAIPLAYALQSGFDSLRLTGIDLTLEVDNSVRLLRVENVWPDRKKVHAGEEVTLTVVLAGENGAELVRQARYQVPIGAPAGPLHFTVADAATTNITELGPLISATPRRADQVVALLNDLRRNSRAYVRVWRPSPGYAVSGQSLPDPPASIALVLGRASENGGASLSGSSRMAEIPIDTGGAAVTGSKTVQVEVEE